MTVDFRNDCAAAVDEDDLVALAAFVMDRMLLHPQAELSISCVEPEAIAVLHEDYLDEPGPTDVMSFPMDELRPGDSDGSRPEGILGDVVLCPSVAAAQAEAAGHSAAHEMRILLTHGILHLLGYDHVELPDEAEMFALQRSLVQQYEARGASV
jgi:probable rRNA maturation factor